MTLTVVNEVQIKGENIAYKLIKIKNEMTYSYYSNPQDCVYNLLPLFLSLDIFYYLYRI